MLKQSNGNFSENPQNLGITHVQVPVGVKYISDWQGFSLLGGHSIYDKTITGCGFTEFCLRSEENVILVSPRKILLENKASQHSHNPRVFHYSVAYKETFDKTEKDYDLDIKRMEREKLYGPSSRSLTEKEEALNEINKMKGELSRFFQSQTLSLYQQPGSTGIKILVTYDSFHHVAEVLSSLGVLDSFRVVVDEFQSIFTDAQFKADIGLNIVSDLSIVKTVTYISATPVNMDHLRSIQQFSQLPYLKLDWPIGFLSTPSIIRSNVTSLTNSAHGVISSYKSGKFPFKKSGNIIQYSTEAVFFVNNVKMIADIITKSKLTPEEVNIICADTSLNRGKVSAIGKTRGLIFSIGSIPLKGTPHKMFTFCTKTAYLGADFYSTCASTFILSDVNITTMAVDIILDFPQIIGRQRLDYNIFKNDITIFYKTRKPEYELTQSNFNAYVAQKNLITSQDLANFSTISSTARYIYLIRQNSVKRGDYSGIQRVLSNVPGQPSYEIIVKNPFLEISDIRAWEIVQVSYQDNLSVTSTINSVVMPGASSYVEPVYLQSDISTVLTETTFQKLLGGYCDLRDKYQNPIDVNEISSRFLSEGKIKAPFESYYSIFGTSECKLSRSTRAILDKRIKERVIMQDRDSIATQILKKLEIGRTYSLEDVKYWLENVFSKIGIEIFTPKAVTIEEFLDVTPVLIREGEARIKSYRINGKLK